ncbi:MAG: hypothetical protein WC924_06190, partial [Candidatus Gracilibacteria bacterium]
GGNLESPCCLAAWGAKNGDSGEGLGDLGTKLGCKDQQAGYGRGISSIEAAKGRVKAGKLT